MIPWFCHNSVRKIAENDEITVLGYKKGSKLKINIIRIFFNINLYKKSILKMSKKWLYTLVYMWHDVLTGIAKVRNSSETKLVSERKAVNVTLIISCSKSVRSKHSYAPSIILITYLQLSIFGFKVTLYSRNFWKIKTFLDLDHLKSEFQTCLWIIIITFIKVSTTKNFHFDCTLERAMSMLVNSKEIIFVETFLMPYSRLNCSPF